MVRNEKILLIVAAIIFAGVFSFLVKVESPSPSFGSGSLYVPEYVVTSTATQATTTLYAFPGVLHTVSVTKPVNNSVITIYDSATTTSPTVAPVVITIANASTSPFTLQIDGSFANGLTVAQSGATSTITFSYQQN